MSDAEWETEEVETSKPVGTVVSVRFQRELAERLFAEAERQGVPTSTIVRDAVESWLSGERSTPATLDITISSAGGGSVALYTSGRVLSGRSAGAPSQIELAH